MDGTLIRELNEPFHYFGFPISSGAQAPELEYNDDWDCYFPPGYGLGSAEPQEDSYDSHWQLRGSEYNGAAYSVGSNGEGRATIFKEGEEMSNVSIQWDNKGDIVAVETDGERWKR